MTALSALAVGLGLTACGTPNGARGGHASNQCVASPPDTVPNSHSVTPGMTSQPPAGLMDSLNFYLKGHADVAAEPLASSDGHLYMGFTSDAPQHLVELRRAVPDPQLVRAYCAEHSYGTIKATMQQLRQDPDLGARIMGMGGGGVDDRIDVGFDVVTPQMIARVRQRYGGIIGQVGQASQCNSC